jgi:hypothetical protein
VLSNELFIQKVLAYFVSSHLRVTKEPRTNTYLGVEKGIESSLVHNEREGIQFFLKNLRITNETLILLTKNNIKISFKIKKNKSNNKK